MKILISTLLLLFPYLLSAQGILNNGGKIVVTTGSFLTITGANGNLTNNTAGGTNGSIDNNGTISLQGNLTNNAANTIFINSNGIGDVIFTGTFNQEIDGASLTHFEKFTLNNPVGLVLKQNVITDALVLTLGPLHLNARSLNITNSNLRAITRTNGYLVSEQTTNSGKVIWNIGSLTGPRVFPFGTSGGLYIPFVLDLTAGDIGNVTVSTYGTGINNQPYPTTPVLVTHVNGWDNKDNSANTVDRFWQIDKDGSSGTATLTFTASPLEVGEVTMLSAQRWNAAQEYWDFPLPGQSHTDTSVTVPDVTTFSPWTISGNNSPLPAELIQFTATVNRSRVDLRWKTASEKNNVFYTIEKTRDLQHYETVTTVKGAGNSQQEITYTAQDAHPYNGISYYRLKQTDYNQQSSYSELIAVNVTGRTDFAVSVFPNPTEGILNITLTGAVGKEYSVLLTDLVGQRYYTGKVITEKVDYTFSLSKTQHFPPGVFLLTVSGNGHFYSKKIIVK